MVVILANFKKTALNLANLSRLEVTPSDFTRPSQVKLSQTSNQVNLASCDLTFRVAATLTSTLVKKLDLQCEFFNCYKCGIKYGPKHDIYLSIQ